MKKAKISILILIVLLIVILIIGWFFRPMASSQNPVSSKVKTTQNSPLFEKTKEKAAKTSSLKATPPSITSLNSATPSSESKASTSKGTLLEKEEREAFYKEIVNAEMMIKSPQNPIGGFEKATVAQLEALEKQYTLKGFELLQDPSDGQLKHVVVFE